jgi:hypothetical protein
VAAAAHRHRRAGTLMRWALRAEIVPAVDLPSVSMATSGRTAPLTQHSAGGSVPCGLCSRSSFRPGSAVASPGRLASLGVRPRAVSSVLSGPTSSRVVGADQAAPQGGPVAPRSDDRDCGRPAPRAHWPAGVPPTADTNVSQGAASPAHVMVPVDSCRTGEVRICNNEEQASRASRSAPRRHFGCGCCGCQDLSPERLFVFMAGTAGPASRTRRR